jgi:hypothetical protein
VWRAGISLFLSAAKQKELVAMRNVETPGPRVNRRKFTLAIEHVVTADLPDGQACPPWIENGVVWHVVYRAAGHTRWRRIRLTT